MPTLHRHRSGEQGFVLPLAMGASLVLLLGSLSAHTVSLQVRLQGIREQQQRRAEDRLASAGQQLLADLQRSHPCLLALPQAIASLRAGQVLGSSYRLVGWLPQLAPAELLLEVAPGGDEPARRGAFAVRMAAAQPPIQPQPQITDVRLVGLRGVVP
jgi:heme exporter protein D